MVNLERRLERAPATDLPTLAAVSVSSEKLSYIEWPAVWAGSFVAAAVSLVLTTFGSAIGLAVASPWSSPIATNQKVGLIAAGWLAFTYIWSFGVGGYLAGRMRPIPGDAWQNEREFRDGVNGLIVWAIGVVIAAILVAQVGSELGVRPAEPGLSGIVADSRAAMFAGFWSALVLLVSGAVAWWAACWGGKHRDRSTIGRIVPERSRQ